MEERQKEREWESDAGREMKGVIEKGKRDMMTKIKTRTK